MGRLILVRHGESEGNRDRLYALDPHSLPLTELGYRQARSAAASIGASFRADVVVSSPFLRARETARLIGESLGLPVTVEADLYEREMGEYRGRPYGSLARAPAFDAARHWVFAPPGGESYEQVRARVAPVLDRLARAHPQRDVVVVSHGGVMLTLWAHITGSWDAAQVAPNCGMFVVEHGPQGYGAPQILTGGSAPTPG